ncbi:BtrH N-terminal domain-containing protein [Klenkia sp. PcliD-1-E]|uniref:BtrH N-terminal domain-containing protein n=1 Tax=Klenkia sp. PcliD-1-E TaxID=2954492 RepID=UPI002096D88A|nr:BtrH N-terminal domain-containing protein [Klenkia sp. PcliD-1-E]MCO7218559.1 BtrH N-terminal domain-containing protein [Klenkia sp. PcliD-1-E]
MSGELADRYPHRMAGHCGSGALRDLLHWQGLGWAGPPGEGLVFALGGALGLSFVRSSQLSPPVYLVGRETDYEVALPRRLGAQVEVLATDDPETGWTWVTREVDAGRPVLIWADIAELPYLNVQLQMSRHDVVVIGYDLDRQTALVVDNDRAEAQLVPLTALARARASNGFPEPTMHRTYRIVWPRQLPPIAGVAADAFRRSANAMRHPSGPGIAGVTGTGSRGLSAANHLVTELRSWVDVPPPDVDRLLFALYAFIEKAGTGGGLFRRLFADGSTEIARLTGDLPTQRVASCARRCSDAWSELAGIAKDRGTSTQTRTAAIARAAAAIPAAEEDLVVALESASRSLQNLGHGNRPDGPG